MISVHITNKFSRQKNLSTLKTNFLERLFSSVISLSGLSRILLMRKMADANSYLYSKYGHSFIYLGNFFAFI